MTNRRVSAQSWIGCSTSSLRQPLTTSTCVRTGRTSGDSHTAATDRPGSLVAGIERRRRREIVARFPRETFADRLGLTTQNVRLPPCGTGPPGRR